MAKSGKPQGFAALSKEHQMACASKGGRAVPKEKRSFSQDRKLAYEAGKKGGMAPNRTSKIHRRKEGQS